MKRKNYFLTREKLRKPAAIFLVKPAALTIRRSTLIPTIRRMAAFLNVSQSTVKSYKSKGYIPYLQADGKGHRVLFFVEDVIEAMNHFVKKGGIK